MDLSKSFGVVLLAGIVAILAGGRTRRLSLKCCVYSIAKARWTWSI